MYIICNNHTVTSKKKTHTHTRARARIHTYYIHTCISIIKLYNVKLYYLKFPFIFEVYKLVISIKK